MDAPSPIYGMLQIATEPNDVTILIDGNIVGKTPYYTNKILIGRHHIELQKHGYKTETKDIKIDEAKLEAINIKLTDYCEATISTLPAWAVISVNDNRYTSPHKLDVYAGNYKIDITAKGYSKYSKTLFLDGNTKDFTVTLSRNYVRNNEFYIAAGYNPIGFQSINGNIGFYYHNINVEGVYSQGMSSSETIYWNYVGDSDYSYAPEEVKYKATAYGGKVGYGLRLSSRFRLTPQIGAMLIKLKSDNSYDFYDGATAINASASLKFSYYINSALGISVAPEYRFGVNKGEGFTNLSDLSSTIKNYVDGVECNVALFLCF
jgi:hypothetical protein